MSGTHWVTEPNGYIEPKIGRSGIASIPAKTVIQVFQETVRKHGDKKALCAKPPVSVVNYIDIFIHLFIIITFKYMN